MRKLKKWAATLLPWIQRSLVVLRLVDPTGVAFIAQKNDIVNDFAFHVCSLVAGAGRLCGFPLPDVSDMCRDIERKLKAPELKSAQLMAVVEKLVPVAETLLEERLCIQQKMDAVSVEDDVSGGSVSLPIGVDASLALTNGSLTPRRLRPSEASDVFDVLGVSDQRHIGGLHVTVIARNSPAGPAGTFLWCCNGHHNLIRCVHLPFENLTLIVRSHAHC